MGRGEDGKLGVGGTGMYSFRNDIGSRARWLTPSTLGGRGRRIAWAQEFETCLGNTEALFSPQQKKTKVTSPKVLELTGPGLKSGPTSSVFFHKLIKVRNNLNHKDSLVFSTEQKSINA